MGSLAQLPEIVGFFSYSREDDKAFRGSLRALRAAIQSELSALLGRNDKNFRLWQDQDAIAPGDMWESAITSAIEQSVFFIPIITPRAVISERCKIEFDSFLARERALGRSDLVFPIHYISVGRDEAEWRDDPVLSIVAKRQYVDFRGYRHKAVDAPEFLQEIEVFCSKIVKKLREPWLPPEERLRQEAEARRRAEEEERVRQEAEAKRQVEERERLRLEAIAKTRAEKEARERQRAEAKLRAKEEEEERLRKEALAKNWVPLTAAQERALKPGDSFKEGRDCPEMIVVPAGRFMMGSPAGRGDDDGRPQHEVTITKPFAVSKFALTFDEWDACAARVGCRPDVSDSGWGRGRRPVIDVSWDDAQAYVKWLSRITSMEYRLLSEAEYEYSARAGTQTTYPWGDDIRLDGRAMANCNGCGSEWDNKQTAPVGSFSPNRFGLFDMVGNVWEWTEDCWNESYRGAPADGSPSTSGDCGRRVVRGGSWSYNPDGLRSATRYRALTDGRNYNLGFRVARTLTS